MEQTFLNDFMTRLRTDDALFGNFVAAAQGGSNKIFQSVRNESLVIDDAWIFTIEGVLFSIEKISRDPRKFIAEFEHIVDVERARKTSAKTVRHLASHSGNVRNIKEDGEVVPKKLLTVELDEEIAIYENRFVGTLVHRLISFVEQRRNELEEHLNMLDETDLNVKSQFKYGKSDILYEMKVAVKSPPEDAEYQQRINEMVEKIDEIRKRLRILRTTPFMQTIDKAKPVHPPIQKTNLLRMHQDYRNCYQLWLYISSYNAVGYSVDIMDKTLPVEGDYFDDLTVLTALSVKSMVENNLLNKDAYEAIPFSDPQRKNFKNLTKYDFQAEFKNDKEAADVESSINEYYYQQMKQTFAKEARVPKTEDPATREKELRTSFARYFNTITRLNNLLYMDLIKKQSPRDAGRTPLQKKEAAYAQQSVIVRRLAQLNRLKTMDLDRTVKLQKRELVRLEQQQQAIEKERERLKKAKIIALKKKEREEKRREQLRQKKAAEKAKKAAEKAKKQAQRVQQKQQQTANQAEKFKGNDQSEN